MKRVLSFLALLLLPLSLMAMTPISDSDMSKVTGQAGVSIDIDMTLNIAFAEMGWGDSDGYGTDDGGWIGLDSLNITHMHIWPRTDYTMEPDGTPAATPAGAQYDGGWSDLQFLTIDVVTMDDGVTDNSGPFYWNAAAVGGIVTKVRIGIPTLTITMEEMTGNVVLGPIGDTTPVGGVVNGDYYAGKNINRPDFNQLMGKFYVGGLNMAMGRDGALLISAHGNGIETGAISNNVLYGSGVTIELDNFTIDYLLLDTAAWGDIDGSEDIVTADAGAADQATARDTEGLNGAGWVGLRDLAIKNITIGGKVLIDVGSIVAAAAGDEITDIHTLGTNPDSGLYEAADEAAFLDLAEAIDEIYTAAFGTDEKTFVSIMLADGFTITMEEMGAQVVLGPDSGTGTPDFSSDQIMGDIYVAGMTMGIYDNQLSQTRSYVHIFAH